MSENPRVIVLGAQKSGTSAIGHLLALLCDLSKTIDLPRPLRPDGHRLVRGEISFEAFAGRHPDLFARELVKIPSLTFVADQVADFFSESRLLAIVRDPRDNIRSLLNRRNLPGDRRRLPWFHRLRMRLEGRALLESMEMNQGGESYIEKLALRWNRATDRILSLGDRAVLVKYETFDRAKVETLRHLASELGLAEKQGIEDQVETPFQPPGDRSVSWLDFFGDANLRAIERLCAENLTRLGYAETRGLGTDQA